jgi:hypothetical protein
MHVGSFGQPAGAHRANRALAPCPGRAKRDTDLGLARDRQLDDASRVNPTCADSAQGSRSSRRLGRASCETQHRVAFGCAVRHAQQSPCGAIVGSRKNSTQPTASGCDSSYRARNWGSRMSRWPSSHLTMSNSAVVFVPAARSGARVVSLCSRPSPIEGRAERRQAHLF